MKIHEYQGKQLFRKAGVPVLEGHVAKTPEEAAAAAGRRSAHALLPRQPADRSGMGKEPAAGLAERADA